MSFDISQLKVLVVDDHMLVWHYVRNALHNERVFDVKFAEDGNKAVDMIEKAYAVKDPFDVVFLDWNMPEISGIGVLTHIRKKPEFDNMAIVMLTAEADLQNVKKAMSSGATSYIVKPPSGAELQKKLEEIYKWVKKRREGG